MASHPRPKDGEPSSFVRKYATRIAHESAGPILDVGCGYGRHALLLATLGATVIGLDTDPGALAFVQEQRRTLGIPEELLTTQRIDLEHDHWPYGPSSVGAVISIHYLRPRLLQLFIDSIRFGGFLLLETIGGQGKNYVELPPVGLVRETLLSSFNVIHFTEKRVGPPNSDAATVKAFAVKVR